MKITRKGTSKELLERDFANRDGSVLPSLFFPSLEQGGVAMNMITTREGGVSEGIFSSMNLTTGRGDCEENVRENFARVAAAFGTDTEHCICSHQVHETNVLRVGKEEAGMGISRSMEWESADGLVTNEPGLVLATFYADCVPLLFVDPVKRAVGASHSGWRGTVGKMGAKTIQKMREEFGTDPADVLVGIGPSICADHYEVSEDVAEEFRKAFPDQKDQLLTFWGNPGHYQLNLWEACRTTLIEAGVREENIHVTDICTACNPTVLFSHRATQGKRGNFAALIMLH